ncbi:tetrahydrobiopterin biosynthesis enzymes-like protein [Wilcoxina mikolae CBS 423.85]|nr:tetrahydrobiopterin biosynthesis enzymes-like protein [Wilcoxina mikolae CBS 423.85]
MTDTIYLRNAVFNATVGRDCWHRDKAQRVLISIRLFTSVTLAGETDDVLKSINYGTVYKAVAKAMDSSRHPNLQSFTEEVCRVGLKVGGGKHVKATAFLPKVLLQAEGVGYEVSMTKQQDGEEVTAEKVLFVKGLRQFCIIGLNKHEREDKQPVSVNIRFHGVEETEESDYQASLQAISKHIENSAYLTLEAFVVSIAKLAVVEMGYEKVTVNAEKPSAYGMVDCPGVEITRTNDSFV